MVHSFSCRVASQRELQLRARHPTGTPASGFACLCIGAGGEEGNVAWGRRVVHRCLAQPLQRVLDSDSNTPPSRVRHQLAAAPWRTQHLYGCAVAQTARLACSCHLWDPPGSLRALLTGAAHGALAAAASWPNRQLDSSCTIVPVQLYLVLDLVPTAYRVQ